MTPHKWERDCDDAGNSWMQKWTCARCGFWYRTKNGRQPPNHLPLPLLSYDSVTGQTGWWTSIPVDCDEAMALKIINELSQQEL